MVLSDKMDNIGRKISLYDKETKEWESGTVISLNQHSGKYSIELLSNSNSNTKTKKKLQDILLSKRKFKWIKEEKDDTNDNDNDNDNDDNSKKVKTTSVTTKTNTENNNNNNNNNNMKRRSSPRSSPVSGKGGQKSNKKVKTERIVEKEKEEEEENENDDDDDNNDNNDNDKDDDENDEDYDIKEENRRGRQGDNKYNDDTVVKQVEVKKRNKNELSEYELQRLERIKKNQEFLATLGISENKAVISSVVSSSTGDNSKRKSVSRKGVKRRVKTPTVKRELPTRRSGRSKGLNPDGTVLEDPELLFNSKKNAAAAAATVTTGRPEVIIPPEPISLETMYTSEEGGKEFLATLMKISKEEEEKHLPSSKGGSGKGKKGGGGGGVNADAMKYASELADLSVRDEDVAKLTTRRITCMAVHPSMTELLVTAGDTEGQFSIWRVDAPDTDVNEGIYNFRPHSNKISYMQYHPMDCSKLYTTSHDGTVRCMDINKMQFDLFYSTQDSNGFSDDGITCGHIPTNGNDSNSMYVSGMNSGMGCIDLRTKKSIWWMDNAHDKKLNSIEINNYDPNYFVTSGLDRTVKIWDKRKASSGLQGSMLRKSFQPISSISHPLSINNATFNPTGESIVTTCQDDRVRIFENAHLNLNGAVGCVKATHTIRHNNHTGRWLSKFWPTWDVKNPHAFVIGSLEQPRRIEIYTVNGGHQIMSLRSDNLNSVCSINQFHPKLNILVGGNSSGRVHIFRKN